MLRETFIDLLTDYSSDTSRVDELWLEIEKNYSSKRRHYHSLEHLENLFTELIMVKDKIKNWSALLFALYYHDVVYNSLKSDNEEKSALLAKKRLISISVPQVEIKLCEEHILSTKLHHKSVNSDTNYFTDADLCVLGQPWETYSRYFKDVRKEYSIYPNFIYNPGRKKVLNHFLAMDRIFKTELFFMRFEDQAKQNLRNELELIG